jgi:hypothetical protein
MIKANSPLRSRPRRPYCVTGSLTVVCLMVTTLPAGAQNPGQVALSGGYANVAGSMHGANVQVSAELSDRWSLVGELNASEGADCKGCTPKYRDIAGLGGVRFGWHPTPRVSPFWQVLAGALRSKAEGYSYDIVRLNGAVEQRYQEGYTVTYFALQPGGGIDLMVTPRFGIRTQADFQVAIPDQNEWEGFSIFPRVVTGVVIRVGR